MDEIIVTIRNHSVQLNGARALFVDQVEYFNEPDLAFRTDYHVRLVEPYNGVPAGTEFRLQCHQMLTEDAAALVACQQQALISDLFDWVTRFKGHLNKYQGRYHEAPHAKKHWDETNNSLKEFEQWCRDRQF